MASKMGLKFTYQTVHFWLVAKISRCYLSFSRLQLRNLIWFSGDNNFTFNMPENDKSKEFLNLPFYHF